MTLYVSDLDGTLIDSRLTIPPESAAGINAAIRRGDAFAVATARTPATVGEILAPISGALPAVVMNGAGIYDFEIRGLIERIQSPDNKKHIEIALQEASKPIIEAGIRVQKQFAKDILSGLTQEEKDICVRVFCTIYENAQAHLNEDNTIS